MSRILVIAAIAVLALPAGGSTPIAVHSGGSLRVDGDSTLHKWDLKTNAVTMTFQLAEGAPESLPEAVKESKIESVEVLVQVADLKSWEAGLAGNMRKAMNAKKYPNIIYRMDHYRATKGEAGGFATATTSGTLTITGVTKPVTFDVEFRPGPKGASVKGSYTLKMSDYGIKPPTLMLGAIKTRDQITIRFDLLLSRTEKTL